MIKVEDKTGLKISGIIEGGYRGLQGVTLLFYKTLIISNLIFKV